MKMDELENNSRSKNKSSLNLSDNQIAVRNAHVSAINEADVIKTHHAVLEDEAGGGEFEELPAETVTFGIKATKKRFMCLFFESACAPLTTAVTEVERVIGSVRVSPSGSGTYNHNGYAKAMLSMAETMYVSRVKPMVGLWPSRTKAITSRRRQLNALERIVEMKKERCMVSRSQKHTMREL